jgi:hypothetical protein
MCPLNHKGVEWCLDCKFAKEGLCDYPYKITGGKNEPTGTT